MAVPALVLDEYVTARVWLRPPAPVTVAVQGVCAVPLYVTLVGHVTVTADVALVMLHGALTDVIVKFADPPVTVGVTVPEPTPGPTFVRLFVQVRAPVNGPVTAQSGFVACAEPS